MSLAQTISQKSYVGNGAQTIFATGFAYRDQSHLTVEVAPAGGAYVTKLLGVDYTVLPAGAAAEPGGNVTFLAAPANLSTVRITRNTPRTQPTSFISQQDFLPAVHEAAFDNEEEQIQELERRLAVLEAGAAPVALAASKVQDTFVCADPPEASFPRNVACVGTPSMVLLGLVEDLSGPPAAAYALGLVDISARVLNQFTVRNVPGLTPGRNYRLTYLVLTL